MTHTLRALIDSASGGAFRWHPEAAADRLLGVDRPGVSRVEIDLGTVHERNGFFRKMAAALAFPAHFGHNLDAFYDCLTDLAGGHYKGLVLVLRDASGFARGEPEEFGAAVDALRDAADYWKTQDKTLIAALELDQPVLASELPEISGP